MSIKVDKQDNYVLIKVESEKLDTTIAPSLKAELVMLNNDGVKNIIVDLTETRYCDSSGLSAILVGYRLCKDAEGSLIITGLQDSVKKIIAIAQLDSRLNITNTVNEATSLLVV